MTKPKTPLAHPELLKLTDEQLAKVLREADIVREEAGVEMRKRGYTVVRGGKSIHIRKIISETVEL